MVENLEFLKCAACIEERPKNFYHSPFLLTEADRNLLKDRDAQSKLYKSIECLKFPAFILDYSPERHKNKVVEFARYDSYILKIVLIIYNIRLKIQRAEKDAFFWFRSDTARIFTEQLSEKETVDAIIKGEIYIGLINPLNELLSVKCVMDLTEYMQKRYTQWREK